MWDAADSCDTISQVSTDPCTFRGVDASNAGLGGFSVDSQGRKSTVASQVDSAEIKQQIQLEISSADHY